MYSNFKDALRLVLKDEGGFVNHPNDPGGATNKGVTIGTYRAYINPKGTVNDLKSISAAQVETVYKRQYWDAIEGDMLPSGVDYATFDFAVNSGPKRAAEYLQAVVGAVVDGDIGDETLKKTRSTRNVDVINRLCDKRMAFLRGLKTWSTFGKGWTARVARVRAGALVMGAVKPSPQPTPVSVPPAPTVPSVAPPAKHWLATLLAAIFGGSK